MGILFSSAISIEKYESSVSVSSTHLPSGSRLHEPCNRGARTRNLRRSESYIVEEERQRSKACNPKANYIGRQLCARGIAGVLPMPDPYPALSHLVHRCWLCSSPRRRS